MTLDEARQKANAAPWAEFRTFMNDTLAGFCAEVQRSLASVDPQARAGLSGTQEPRAGNGMDWWKMSQGFNYLPCLQHRLVQRDAALVRALHRRAAVAVLRGLLAVRAAD